MIRFQSVKLCLLVLGVTAGLGCEYHGQAAQVVQADPDAVNAGTEISGTSEEDQRRYEDLLKQLDDLKKEVVARNEAGDEVIVPSVPLAAPTPVSPINPANPVSPSTPVAPPATPSTPTPAPTTPVAPNSPAPAPQPVISFGDREVPRVVSSLPGPSMADQPTNLAAIEIQFNEPMKPETVTMGFFGPGYLGLIATHGTPDASRKIYRWTLKAPLEGKSEYSIIVPATVEDAAGNKMGSIFRLNFHTEDNKGIQRVDLVAPGLSLREYYRIDGSGGAGGAASEHVCPEGEAMVGPRLVEDGVIASVIDYSCQDINHLSDASKKHAIMLTPTRQPGTIVKDYNAAAGEVFIGFHSKTVEKNDSLVIGEFVPSFAKLTASSVDSANRRQSDTVAGAGSGDTWSAQICPKGFAQVGLRIRAGGYVDRLGSVCRRVALASEPAPAVTAKPTVSAYEGYEFGFVEYDWSGESNGSGENSQPVMGGDRIDVMECSPGQAVKGVAVHANEIIDQVYGLYCVRPDDGSGSAPQAYITAAQQAGSDPAVRIIEAAKGNYWVGWGHKRSENDADGDQDEVMVAELAPFQQAFDAAGALSGVPTGIGGPYGQGIGWDGADDNYTDWINETCPTDKGYVLSGIKMKIENNRPRALGGICRRIIPAGVAPGFGEKF